MPSTTSAIVVAVIAAVASLGGALFVEISRRRAARALRDQDAERQKELEAFKDRLVADRDRASRASQAAEVMATYRNPLLRSAYDLQSRLYNIAHGFNGRRDPEYFRSNTLFVVAEFLGWLEIIRGEIQFLDADVDDETRGTQERIDRVRWALAEDDRRVGLDDGLYIYRGQQRAIGELMVEPNPASGGPAQRCQGYAAFVANLDEDPRFAGWFARLGPEIDRLRECHPLRLTAVQHAVIDLIDTLDPDQVRLPYDRGKIERSGRPQ